MRADLPSASAGWIVAASALTLGCGAVGQGTGFDGGAGDRLRDATVDTAPDVGADARITLSDGTSVGEACVGLACQQTCKTTIITGKVYDPAGLIPLYNVYVYVPNAPLDPLPSGPECKPCQAPASGNPLVSATTSADGTFSLLNAPDGEEIPIVLQLGKWRRHLTVPKVDACLSNSVGDGVLRLPRKQHETSPDDNIPLIALTTGCDGAECFLNTRIGIDVSEFTDPSGTGRVHVYKGNAAQQTFPTEGDANELWKNAAQMNQYDILFDACECSLYDRGGAGTTNLGYVNFRNYLDLGGRAFTTHFFVNFFADQTQCDADVRCQGQTPLPTVGLWEGNKNLALAPDADCPRDSMLISGADCLNIDTTIPKGKAFSDWYADNNASLLVGGGESPGHVGLTDIRFDMGTLDPSLVTAGTATPWLYAGDVSSGVYDAYYLSLNTPVGTDATTQCGRAIFSDVHLSDAPLGTFPGYCSTNPAMSTHAPNELALEFLFFDLASCVQNDTQPPPPPPP
jgi:hypothetical protein